MVVRQSGIFPFVSNKKSFRLTQPLRPVSFSIQSGKTGRPAWSFFPDAPLCKAIPACKKGRPTASFFTCRLKPAASPAVRNNTISTVGRPSRYPCLKGLRLPFFEAATEISSHARITFLERGRSAEKFFLRKQLHEGCELPHSGGPAFSGSGFGNDACLLQFVQDICESLSCPCCPNVFLKIRLGKQWLRKHVIQYLHSVCGSCDSRESVF